MINLAIKIKMSGTIDSPYRVLVITKPTRTGSASTAPSSGSATVPAPGSFGGSGDESSDEDFFDASDMTLLTTASVPARPTTAPTLSLPALSVVSDHSVPIVPRFVPGTSDEDEDELPELEETVNWEKAEEVEEAEKGEGPSTSKDIEQLEEELAKFQRELDEKLQKNTERRKKRRQQRQKRMASTGDNSGDDDAAIAPQSQFWREKAKNRKEQLEQKVQMRQQKREEKRERRLADRASTTEVGYTFH